MKKQRSEYLSCCLRLLPSHHYVMLPVPIVQQLINHIRPSKAYFSDSQPILSMKFFTLHFMEHHQSKTLHENWHCVVCIIKTIHMQICFPNPPPPSQQTPQSGQALDFYIAFMLITCFDWQAKSMPNWSFLLIPRQRKKPQDRLWAQSILFGEMRTIISSTL